MKAVVQRAYGAPADVLHLEDVDPPTIGDEDVLLHVRAAGVNWADWAITSGVPLMFRLVYGMTRPRQGIRGTDVAGIVAAVGARVTTLSPGDEVFGWCDGAFAMQARAPAANLVVKPRSLTFEQAAGVPMAGMVALQALRDVAAVQPGQHVLVNGASGGIGSFAVQIARVLDTEVTGVCSTPNLELVRSLGADHVIDYTREDFTTSGLRYDLILDMADTHSLSVRRRVLTPTGTLIPNSGAGGRWIGSLGRILRAWLVSPVVSQKLRPFLSTPDHDDLAALAAYIEAGAVTPVVGRTFQLADAADAVDLVGTGHARGKTVITI